MLVIIAILLVILIAVICSKGARDDVAKFLDSAQDLLANILGIGLMLFIAIVFILACIWGWNKLRGIYPNLLSINDVGTIVGIIIVGIVSVAIMAKIADFFENRKKK